MGGNLRFSPLPPSLSPFLSLWKPMEPHPRGAEESSSQDAGGCLPGRDHGEVPVHGGQRADAVVEGGERGLSEMAGSKAPERGLWRNPQQSSCTACEGRKEQEAERGGPQREPGACRRGPRPALWPGRPRPEFQLLPLHIGLGPGGRGSWTAVPGPEAPASQQNTRWLTSETLSWCRRAVPCFQSLPPPCPHPPRASPH